MILSLKYGDLAGAVNQAIQLARELDGYCNELYSKINKKIDQVEGGVSSNLGDSKYYVSSKIVALNKKKEDVKTLARRLVTLGDTAKRVDGEVKSAIEREQKDFFKKNPSLKPNIAKRIWVGFVCGLKDAAEAIGNFIYDVATGVTGALITIWNGIKEFWKNNRKTIVAVFVIAVASVLLIASGGTLAIIGAGLLFGLLSTLISDVASNALSGKRVSEWKLSSWQEYTGAAVGNAAGFAFGAATGQWGAGSGAITGFVTSLTTSMLNLISGESKQSLLEIGVEAIISGAVSGAIGGVVNKAMNSGAMKSLDKTIGLIFNRKAGALTGSGSNIGSMRMAMSNLWRGNWGKIGLKTIRNIFASSIAGSAKKLIDKEVTKYLLQSAMEHLVTPAVKNFERTFNLPPIYEYKWTLPINKKDFDLTKPFAKVVFG